MAVAVAVTAEDLALPALDQNTPNAAVFRDPAQMPLEAALSEVGALLEQYSHIVVPVSAVTPAPLLRRLHTLRSMMESGRLVIIPVDLPPLGVAVLARQLRQLSVYDLGPGVVASAARLLKHYVYAGALLGSVSKLDRVPVSLKAHAKSWAPGKLYAALAQPVPQLVKAESGASLSKPEYATQVVFAQGQLKSDWVTTTLAPAWQAHNIYKARLPEESPHWWGTSKLVEFAAFIFDSPTLYQVVRRVETAQCGWCDFELIGDHCVLCDVPVAPGENRAATGAVPQGGAGAPTGSRSS